MIKTVARSVALAVCVALAATLGGAQAAAADPVATACPDVQPASQPAGTPVRILAIGDSISAVCQWQIELSRLLAAAGTPNVITTYAVPGKRCNYFPGKMADILAQTPTDLAILYCGTNDDPQEQCWGESCTSWSFRSIVESIHGSRTPAPLTLGVLIGYSDATLAPSWVWQTNEPAVNDRLWSQMPRYLAPAANPPWLAGVADLQRMPGTDRYLDGEGCDPTMVPACGIHPNAYGYRTVGRIFYDAMRGALALPDAVTLGEPVLCGMAGHRIGYPRPVSVPCP